MVFIKEDEDKVKRIVDYSDKLYDYLQSSIATNKIDKKMLMIDFDLNEEEISNIEIKKNKVVSFSRKIIGVQLATGAIYCYFHSRKLFRLNKGIIKSLYCWPTFILSLYFSIAYSMYDFKTTIQKECDNLYIIKNYDTKDTYQINKLRAYLNMYKKVKFVEKHMT